MSPTIGELESISWRWYKIKSGHWWRWYIWHNKNNFGIQTPFGLFHKYTPPVAK